MALTDATTRLPNRPHAAFGIKDHPPRNPGNPSRMAQTVRLSRRFLSSI